MEFNIKGKFNDLLNESLWFLSEGCPPDELIERFEIAYIESRSMFVSDNPFILTIAQGRKPITGQIAPGVFFCPARQFQFGECTLLSTSFWQNCFRNKSFIDTLVTIGGLLQKDAKDFRDQLSIWEKKEGLHCMNVFLQ